MEIKSKTIWIFFDEILIHNEVASYVEWGGGWSGIYESIIRCDI